MLNVLHLLYLQNLNRLIVFCSSSIGSVAQEPPSASNILYYKHNTAYGDICLHTCDLWMDISRHTK